MQRQRGRQKSNEYALRLYNLYIGGLMALDLVVLQVALSADIYDVWLITAVAACTTAISLLGGVLIVNFVEERYRYGRSQSLSAKLLTVCFIVGAVATFVGLDAILWHFFWLVGMIFPMLLLIVTVIVGWHVSELHDRDE